MRSSKRLHHVDLNILPSTLIIGAGMAGLTAARQLVQNGHAVTLLDKGRGVGGRMATRRMTDATPPARADHGIPFVTPQTPAFQALLNQLVAKGVASHWSHTGPTNSAADLGYIGIGGMNAVAKDLANGLTIHTSETVVRIGTRPTGWQVETESGSLYRADWLLVTIPAPQALSLLKQSGLTVGEIIRQSLEQVVYQPGIAVLALLNCPSQIPAPGFIIPADENARPSGFDGRMLLIDNGQKGISQQTTVTVLLDTDTSQARFDADLPTAGQGALAELENWIPASAVTSVQVHRWRFSLPEKQVDGWFLEAETPFPLLFGGDGFSGAEPHLSQWPNGLESAFWSGLKMAERLMQVGQDTRTT